MIGFMLPTPFSLNLNFDDDDGTELPKELNVLLKEQQISRLTNGERMIAQIVFIKKPCHLL